jgi:adenine-specific DNA methylase
MTPEQKDSYIKKLEESIERQKATIKELFGDAVILSKAFRKFSKPVLSIPNKYVQEHKSIDTICKKYHEKTNNEFFEEVQDVLTQNSVSVSDEFLNEVLSDLGIQTEYLKQELQKRNGEG